MYKVSILFSTYKRGSELSKTLNSFCDINFDLPWEIVLVDNEGNNETKRIASTYAGRLNLTYLVETTPGKNSALNLGLSVAKGDIIVLTDDDIIASASWLREVYDGCLRNPQADIFGGKILPSFPSNVNIEKLPYQLDMPFIITALVIANWGDNEGDIEPDKIWGPNMAVRKSVFDSGEMFDVNVGPNGKNYIMGSETEFITRCFNKGFKLCYLPNAIVEHQIRPEQLTIDWMRGRSFRVGRTTAAAGRVVKGRMSILNCPTYIYKNIIIETIKSGFFCVINKRFSYFSSQMKISKFKGMIYQLQVMYREKGPL